MKSGHDTKTNGNLRTNPSTSILGEGDEGSATTSQKLNHSTSSSESSSEYCFQLTESETFPLVSFVSQTEDEDNDVTPIQTNVNTGHGNEHVSRSSCDSFRTNNTRSSIECSPKVAFKISASQLEDYAMALKNRSEEEMRANSRPGSKQLSYDSIGSPLKPESRNSSTTQFPPTQVMERPVGGDNNSPGYRIPDYVFARTKSTAPMEWSTASNESLFSIHMGNMSFNKDQMSWVSKSEELGKTGELTNNRPVQSAQNNSQATEAKAAEIMREVIRESAENWDKDGGASSPNKKSAKISHQQNEGTQSFAFPRLTGETASLKKGGGEEKQTPKSGVETPKSTSFMAGVTVDPSFSPPMRLRRASQHMPKSSATLTVVESL
ncbi:hypothetical protein CsatA_001555 [Cannabis sativa]